MARIVGVTEGLRAGSIKHPDRQMQRAPEQKRCKLCDGLIPRRKGRFLAFSTSLDDHDIDGGCLHCVRLLGVGAYADVFAVSTGVTSLSPDECITRIAALQSSNWGMILMARSFGTEGGHIIEIEPGDIVKVQRAGLSQTSNEALEYCSQSRSKERFSIEIMIGPLPLILWPHEIAAVSWLTIMDLKRAEEIEESFVAAEDECGYFRPRADLRQQIYDAFGRITGLLK